MAPSLVNPSPLADIPTARLRHSLADLWGSESEDMQKIVIDFVRDHLNDGAGKNASAHDALAAVNESSNEQRIIGDLCNLVPVCCEPDKLSRWWRQCVRYLQMFELLKVPEGKEMDVSAIVVKASKFLQQRASSLLLSKLEGEARHCVEISCSQVPGATFSLVDISRAIVTTIQSNARPTPLEQEITDANSNANMWFIMDAWDAPSKVMQLNDPIATTQNFLAVYERYLECPALLVHYVQVLRECSVAAANCLLQDKFMDSDMPQVRHVGKYIADVVLPLLRVTKPQWVQGEIESKDEAQNGRNLHWSRAKRCFACGSDEHSLSGCHTVPHDCTVPQLEEMRLQFEVPAGYKWRAAKTVLKMHKYSATLRSRQEEGNSSTDPDDSFMAGLAADSAAPAAPAP